MISKSKVIKNYQFKIEYERPMSSTLCITINKSKNGSNLWSFCHNWQLVFCNSDPDGPKILGQVNLLEAIGMPFEISLGRISNAIFDQEFLVVCTACGHIIVYDCLVYWVITQHEKFKVISKIHGDTITSVVKISNHRVLTSSLDGKFSLFDILSEEVKNVVDLGIPIRLMSVSEVRKDIILLTSSAYFNFVKVIDDFADFDLSFGVNLAIDPVVVFKIIDNSLYISDQSKKLSAISLNDLSPVLYIVIL